MCSPSVPDVRLPASPWLDRLGMATSTLCAVHCAATALLMGTMTALGAGGLGAPWVEGAFLAVSVLVGAISLGHSVRRHRSPTPWSWFAAGLVLLLVVRPMVQPEWLEVVVVGAGAFCVVRAHWQNARLRPT